MLLSVVIATYNRAELLHRALRSVLAQFCGAFEVVVADDGSTDETASLLQSINDPRLVIIQGDHRGATTARNRGVDASKGDFVTFLDDDDEALPGWLHEYEKAVQRHGADIVSCGFLRLSQSGRLLDVCLPREMGSALRNVRGMFTHSGTYLVPRQLFLDVGGFSQELPAAHHTELAFRLIPRAVELGKLFATVDRPLVRYYQGRLASIRANDKAVYEAAKYILMKHGDLLKADRRRLSNSHATAGVRAMRLGYQSEARAHLRAALRFDLSNPKAWGRVLLSMAPPLAHRYWVQERSVADDLQR